MLSDMEIIRLKKITTKYPVTQKTGSKGLFGTLKPSTFWVTCLQHLLSFRGN